MRRHSIWEQSPDGFRPWFFSDDGLTAVWLPTPVQVALVWHCKLKIWITRHLTAPGSTIQMWLRQERWRTR